MTTDTTLPNETKRIHPLVAGAAAAVIIASGVGVAAVMGYLPGSSAEKADPAQAPAVAAAKPASKHSLHDRLHASAYALRMAYAAMP